MMSEAPQAVDQLTAEREAALTYCFSTDPHRASLVRDGAEALAAATGAARHDLLVVLGSGLRGALDSLGTVTARIPLGDLPGVPVPSAEGHGSELLSVELQLTAQGDLVAQADEDPSAPAALTDRGAAPQQSIRLLVATGRSHLYEGWSPTDICQLARIASMTGIRAAFVSNAGGALREWSLGDLMAITDHINLTGSSPFLGPAFTDISHVWDPELTALIRPHAQREGVYALLRGPEYQTRSESLMLRSAGVDMVGMSTVLEAIALHQMGVRVCGVSVTSDLSFAQEATSHEDVLRAVMSAHGSVRASILAIAQALADRSGVRQR